MAAKHGGLGVTPFSSDSAQWYQDVVAKAQLADRGPAKGTMVMRPYGYRLWELLQTQLDARFKATGHENAYFPLFIPMSYIQREAEHIEGFAPELAVVTHAGGKELEEPLVVRPTSETVIGEMYARWIDSYRDLPLLINQWANVVRWELRPRIFLRTTEFLWQEGHTAHATETEAMEETLRMLGVYRAFCHDVAAIPVLDGEKTATERFAGAKNTYTVEGMMRDGKALQCGTSHYLGTNFAKTFDITFTNENNEATLCHTTSWGMSTRMIGATIMAHGDDAGLIMPPRLAPHQIVIIPIGPADARDEVATSAEELAASLRATTCAGLPVRVHVDHRDARPGFKFNDWELKGVPLRVELGPRDIAAGNVVVASRLGEIRGGEGKATIARDQFVTGAAQLLDDFHDALLARARQFRDENTHTVDTWQAFSEHVEQGFVLAFHCGQVACEGHIKAATAATPRCIPNDVAPESGGVCIKCGKPSAYDRRLAFARAY